MIQRLDILVLNSLLVKSGTEIGKQKKIVKITKTKLKNDKYISSFIRVSSTQHAKCVLCADACSGCLLAVYLRC